MDGGVMEKNSLAEKVDYLEKQLVGMKLAQPVGQDSVRAYETLTNFVWDYDYTYTSANYNGITYTHGFKVIFTSRNQSAPFASVRFMAEVNGVRYNPLSAQNFNGGPTTGTDNSFIEVNDDTTFSGSLTEYALDNTVRWNFSTTAKTVGTNIKIKIIVTATDQGKIELKLNQTF